MYSIATTAYLSSYHRFVTNPTKKEMINGTDINKVEPGLGESDLFYSCLVTVLNSASVVGGLLSGLLVRCVPHWYQYMLFISLQVLGYLLYGTASNGWMLAVGMSSVGLFLGAEVTLGYNYANELSVQFVEVLEQQEDSGIKCDKKRVVKIRNYLYTMHSVGYGVGYTIATSIAVLFSHLPIEQYRSVAWFNVAAGLVVLVSFAFFFRGESSWNKVSNCRKICACNRTKSDGKYGPLQLFIIVSMHFLSFVEMLKWAYFEVLLVPVLSDSFGLSLGVSSFFYLGLAIPRIGGALFVMFLQRIRVPTQIIAIIGLVLSIIGYGLVSDWQAIPYDPCTEYSPFHHPQLYQNQTLETHTNAQLNNPVPTFTLTTMTLDLSSDIVMKFDDNHSVDVKIPFGLPHTYSCEKDNNRACSTCKTNHIQPCLSIFRSDNGTLTQSKPPHAGNLSPLLYTCTLDLSISQLRLCVHLYKQTERNITKSNGVIRGKSVAFNASIQSLMVLSDDVYAMASSTCMNASNGRCHWIPFSTLTQKKCVDCPPICRSKHQIITLPQLIIGLAILIITNPLIWVPTIAMGSNQTPVQLQGIVIGGLNSINAVGQSVGPVLVDTLYERAQKRTFLSSIILASLHVPFLIEIIVLYQQLGPRLAKSGSEYTQLKDSSQAEDYRENNFYKD